MLRSSFQKIYPVLVYLLIFVAPMRAGILPLRGGDEEYALKATFIYRFTDYIEWNENRSDFFSIGILGESPITGQLIQIAKVKKIKDRKIHVIQYNDLDAIDYCHILFVPADCSVPLETILARFASKPVLIVTEKPGYAQRGAHLNFVLVENRLKFEVNTKMINKSNISISALLLQHAIIVE